MIRTGKLMLTTLCQSPRRAMVGILLGATLLLGACQSDSATTTATAPAETEAATPVHTAAYVCPMNCEGSASDKPGKCPVCEMDLVANPAAAAPGAQ